MLHHRQVGRHLQAELPAGAVFFFGGGAGGGDHIFGQAGQLGLVGDPFGEGIGGIEDVLGELGRQCGLFLGDGLEARFLCLGQFGAGEAEVAQFVVDDALAHRRQAGVFGAVVQRAEFAVERFVLPQIGVEAADLGQQIVVGGAPVGGVHHAVHVADHAPGAAEVLSGFGHGDDEVVPGGRGVGRFECRQGRARGVEQVADGRRHMRRRDAVEVREVSEIEKRVVGDGGHEVSREEDGPIVGKLRPGCAASALPVRVQVGAEGGKSRTPGAMAGGGGPGGPAGVSDQSTRSR